VSSLPPTLIRRLVLAPLAVVAALGEVVVSAVLLLAPLQWTSWSAAIGW